MKKTLIYYFSGTGNTWFAAKGLNEALTALGCQSEYISMEQTTPEEAEKKIKEADHLIMGFPVYGSASPRPMRHFAESLPSLSIGLPLTIFATHAMASGDSAYHLGVQMEQKGYALRQTRHFTMMNNFHIPKFRFIPPKNDHRLDKSLENVSPKIKKLAREIYEGKTSIIGKNPMGQFFGNLQRKHIDQIISKIGRDFYVNKKACLDCGKCVKICPTGNISQAEGTYRFGSDCALCLRCYSQCPSSAILIGKGSEDIKKFPRYKGPGKDFKVSYLTGGEQ